MDSPGQPESEAPETERQTNVDRLLGHLPEDSLAAALVRAALEVVSGQSSGDAMKAVIQEQLEQAKVPRDAAED